MQNTLAASLPLRDSRGPRFWNLHVLLPLCLFAPPALVLATTDLDRRIAWAWAYDAALGGFAARDSFWAETVLHTQGRNLVWLVVLSCVAILLGSLRSPDLQSWRRPAGFVVITIGLTTALIGGLKQITQVHCPWDLQGFGGAEHYVGLFAQRVPALTYGACFPGAHAGSGFALFAVYFALRDRHPRASQFALLAAALIGALFAFGQEARGAHFLSHDLWSACIAWFSCLALYLVLNPRAAERRRLTG